MSESMAAGKVLILRGLPGSGKSRFARAMRGEIEKSDPVVVVSADDFFVDSVTKEYRFNPADQGRAHAVCFHGFLTALRRRVPLVIVDNTNTQQWEISPYTLAAEAHGYAFELRAFRCRPETAHARNVHGVPMEVVQKMAAHWQPPMPWWHEETIDTEANSLDLLRVLGALTGT